MYFHTEILKIQRKNEFWRIKCSKVATKYMTTYFICASTKQNVHISIFKDNKILTGRLFVQLTMILKILENEVKDQIYTSQRQPQTCYTPMTAKLLQWQEYPPTAVSYPNSNLPFHIVPKWATLMPLYFLQYHHHPNPLRHISIYNWLLYYFSSSTRHQNQSLPSIWMYDSSVSHRARAHTWTTDQPANVEGIHALYYLLSLVTCQWRQISPSFLLGSPSGLWSIWSEEESLLRIKNLIAQSS